MFGFRVRIVRVDPHKSMVCLRGRFPGIEIDISGAGDHLPVVDVRIRHIKENARTLIQSLDFDLPRAFIKYLITYCVSRMNVRTGSASSGHLCPRVKMTGRKVNYKTEFALKFGDCVEAKDPGVVSNSMDPRTQTCKIGRAHV